MNSPPGNQEPSSSDTPPAPDTAGPPVAAEPNVPPPPAPLEPPLPATAPEPPSPPLPPVVRWLAANTAPLLVAAFVLTVAIVNDMAFAGRGFTLPKSPAAPLPMPSQTLTIGLHNAGFILVGFALLAGACVCFIGSVTWCVSAHFRAWVSENMRHAVRALPALRGLDAVAVFLVWLCSMRVLGLNLLATASLQPGELLAASLLVNGVGMLFALMACVFLAQHRAGGNHGSNGIWPFWKLAGANPPRSVWHDIGLGMLAYPLLFWLVYLAIIVNQFLVNAMGVEPDQHTLITELAKPHSKPVLAIIFVMATAGAAFFEELLFRGMLYNVLRRHFGAVAAACCAALLFSAAHMVYSQLFGLFVLALILTWLYDRTGRLVASMTLHAVNNLVSLWLALQVLQPGG